MSIARVGIEQQVPIVTPERITCVRPVSASSSITTRRYAVTCARESLITFPRGGMAALSAMFSRAFAQDLRQTRKNCSYPTVDDPTRAAR